MGELIMTITYTLWQGSQLLSVGNKATSADELLTVMTELNKLGKGFSYNIREVEVNKITHVKHEAVFI